MKNPFMPYPFYQLLKNIMKNLNTQRIANYQDPSVFIIILCLLIGFNDVFSQRSCGTVDHIHHLDSVDPNYKENRRNIERFTEQYMDDLQRLGKSTASGREQAGDIITIPIVFHIFHNGDAVGSGENISNTLIQAQLDQLNDDFRRTNSDSGNTPSDFTGVAADTEIQFCLAEIKPDGTTTTGINRYNISSYNGDEADCWVSSYIGPKFVSPTIWDRNKYLNFYSVSKIQTTQNGPCEGGILGYAPYPGGGASTDAVVCLASSMGSIATPNPAGGAYGKGRTGTHEVGHWLNLIHIWGDGDCSVDDQVADTPVHGEDNGTGSPCTYPGPNTCGAGTPGDLADMFQNYMDYSTDDCMNLFTAGQKTRMRAAIEASRPGLITSACGATPVNDLRPNAITIDCNTASYNGTTVDATRSDEPENCGTATSTTAGVWYTMQGAHGEVTLDICGTTFDSKMSIFEDDGNGGLICIDGEDDDFTNCGDNDPYLTYSSILGKSYYIYVHGFGGGTGPFTLNISCDCYNTVVNSNDDGPGSLRQAVACADPGDVITFDPSTDMNPIMLTSGQININKDLTIKGNGMSNTIIDGSSDGLNRIFSINGSTVKITDVTIQNGGSSSFTGNGGGLEIYNAAILSISKTHFLGNRARLGGAMMNWGGSISAVNCIFSDNQAAVEASVLWHQGIPATSSFDNCLFYENQATDNFVIKHFAGTDLIVSNCTFADNTNPTCLVFQANDITNNTIFVNSGIAFSSSPANANHNLADVATNLNAGMNGNILGSATFVDAAADDYRLQDNSLGVGAGDSSLLPVDACDVDGDSNDVEIIDVDLDGNPRIAGCSANLDMGAYENAASSSSLVVTNSNDDGSGSLRYVIECANAGDEITFDGSTDGNNIFLTSGQIIINKNLTITGNGIDETIVDGDMDDVSRIFNILADVTVKIQKLTIQNGGSISASADPGSGITSRGILDLNQIKMKGNEVSNKVASTIFVLGGSTRIINSIFEENLNSSPGGGFSTIWIQGSSSITINQSLFVGNTGQNIVYAQSSNYVEFRNNTSYNNTAANHIYAVEQGAVNINNNIISESGSALYLGSGITGSSITNNLSGLADPQLPPADDNIVGDPLFTNPVASDFTLQAGSPCFNTGDSSSAPTDFCDVDGDTDFHEIIPTDLGSSANRIISLSIDMGAYERLPHVCEETFDISCGETVTEDITNYIVSLDCGNIYTSKIHTFTAITSGNVTFDLSNFSSDISMYFYDDLCGSSCDPLVSSSTNFTYSVTTGTTYYIEVYDDDFAGGTYDLNVSCTDPCEEDIILVSPDDDISGGGAIAPTNKSIYATNKITGTSTVDYSAGTAASEGIYLNEGFEVGLGANFHAYMEGCSVVARENPEPSQQSRGRN